MKRENIGSTLQSLYEELGEWDEVQRAVRERLEEMEKPITHGGTDRRAKLCRCCSCGIEVVCTSTFDFYTRDGDDDGPLYCYPCLRETASKKSRKRPARVQA